jgi:hypothetical protein
MQVVLIVLRLIHIISANGAAAAALLLEPLSPPAGELNLKLRS